MSFYQALLLRRAPTCKWQLPPPAPGCLRAPAPCSARPGGSPAPPEAPSAARTRWVKIKAWRDSEPALTALLSKLSDFASGMETRAAAGLLNQGATPAPGQQTGRVTQNPLQNPQILPEPTLCPSPGMAGCCRNAPTRLPADFSPHPLPVGWPQGTHRHPDAAACHHGSLLCHQPGLAGPGAALGPCCWEMPILHQPNHVARHCPIFL